MTPSTPNTADRQTTRALPVPPYAELAVTSNFTFLSGGTHPEEYAQLAADFNQFGDALTFNSNLSDGFFSGLIEVPNLAVDSPFVGQNVYLVIGDGLNLASSSEVMVIDSCSKAARASFN